MPPEKEIELLLGAVENTSRHARNLLFIFVVSSGYVLIAAYTDAPSEMLNLPILNVTVATAQFFLYSPIILLSIFVYLQIYLSELDYRVETLDDQFKSKGDGREDLSAVIFPWIGTFSSRASEVARRTTHRTLTERRWFVKGVSAALLYASGPFVLFAIWYRYIGNEDVYSLIPCICLIVAIYASEATGKFVVPNLINYGISGFLLIATLVAVPELWESFGLGPLWDVLTNPDSQATDVIDVLSIGRLTVIAAAIIALAMLVAALFPLIQSNLKGIWADRPQNDEWSLSEDGEYNTDESVDFLNYPHLGKCWIMVPVLLFSGLLVFLVFGYFMLLALPALFVR